MSDYTQITNFTTKDALASGDPAKIAKGSDIDAELAAISTAIATKANSASPTFTGTVTVSGVTAAGNATFSGANTHSGTNTFSGNNTHSGSETFSGLVDVAKDMRISSDLSPSQITANQNDYNPTDLSTAAVLRLSSDATRAITGIQGGADGRVLKLINVGSNTIILSNESASSSAANRFSFSIDAVLLANESVSIWYDSTSSRWRTDNYLPRHRVLATGSVSATANMDVDWTLFTAFKHKRISVATIPATDAVAFWVRLSADGSTFDAGASNYDYMFKQGDGAVGDQPTGFAGATQIALTDTNVGSGSAEGLNVIIDILDSTDTAKRPRITWTTSYTGSNATPQITWSAGVGSRVTAQDTQAIRVLPSSGNQTGSWVLEGWN